MWDKCTSLRRLIFVTIFTVMWTVIITELYLKKSCEITGVNVEYTKVKIDYHLRFRGTDYKGQEIKTFTYQYSAQDFADSFDQKELTCYINYLTGDLTSSCFRWVLILIVDIVHFIAFFVILVIFIRVQCSTNENYPKLLEEGAIN